MTDETGATVQIRGKSFQEWCLRRGVWPPMHGTPIAVAFDRLGRAFVEYVDEMRIETAIQDLPPPPTPKEKA